MENLIQLEPKDLSDINKQTPYINKQKEARKKSFLLKCSIILIVSLLIALTVVAIVLFKQNKQLQKQINNDYLYLSDNFHSNLLNKETIDLFKKWLPPQQMKDYKLELIYKATRDGCQSDAFLERVRGLKPTLSVFLSKENKIFGGYTEQPWDKPYADKNAFLFSITDKERYPICETHRAIDTNMNIVMRFGMTDLTILGDCLNKPSSTSIPSGAYYMKKSLNPTNEIGFGLKEIEVYTLRVKS